MKNVFIKLGFAVASTNKTTMNFFNPLGHLFKLLLGGLKSDGMMSEYRQDKIFSSKNKGLLLDGKDKRLSGKESFNHLALISRTGGGKTTSYVIPNIFKLATEKNSMVITDISGELFEQTSGFLKSKGYKIYVLNPENLDESIGFNPLFYIKDSLDIDELVNVLIKSNKEITTPTGESEYWDNGAKLLISIFIKVLLSKNDYRYINLSNVRHLINNFGTDGEALYPLIDKYADDTTYNDFRGFIKMNPQTMLSILSTANVALSPIGINENLAKLTANHTINFDKFREEKSVIYIKIPGQKQKQYRFLLNIFYSQFFSYMMDNLPTEKDLPIYCLLDEFGNMNLPNFDTTITTIRKYKISISIILQDTNQLEKTYGKANSETILNGGISSKLYYSGAGLPTTKILSEMLGEIENIKTDVNGNFYYKDEKVMKSSEIRTMADDEALFITANLIPAKLKIKPFYKDFIFKNHTKLKPFTIDSKNHLKGIEYLDLEEEQGNNE